MFFFIVCFRFGKHPKRPSSCSFTGFDLGLFSKFFLPNSRFFFFFFFFFFVAFFVFFFFSFFFVLPFQNSIFVFSFFLINPFQKTFLFYVSLSVFLFPFLSSFLLLSFKFQKDPLLKLKLLSFLDVLHFFWASCCFDKKSFLRIQVKGCNKEVFF